VKREEVRELLRALSRMNDKERQALPGLDPSRADVIVAGVAILDGVMSYLELDELEVSRRGIRDGLLIDTLRRAGLWDAQDPDKALREAVETLGRRCGFDFGHARQVTKLALSLFDTLQPKITAGGPRSVETQTARRVLEVAAMLHDIGTFVSYARHHKHSAYLIANAEIPGLTENEKALASNVARYHRRAHPRDRHPEFVVMPENNRQMVRKLAGILRIADGLDRTHDARVRSIHVRGRGNDVHVGVESGRDLELELWAVRQKAALFSEAFDAEVHFKSVDAPKKTVAPGPASGTKRRV
jgi:exopolyphosphatase / guanosine-5'-triphosphate,3'-diphosphate pyrophosphatase